MDQITVMWHLQQSLPGRKLAFDLYCGNMRKSHTCLFLQLFSTCKNIQLKVSYLTFLLCCLATIFDINTRAKLQIKCKFFSKRQTVTFLNKSHDCHFVYICIVMRSREIMWCIAPSGTTTLRIACSVGCAIIFLLVSRHEPDFKTVWSLNSCTSGVMMHFSVVLEEL